MAEFDGGNLYDINKALIAKNEKPLNKKLLTYKTEKILIPYFEEKKDEQYFMLLCNEHRDYTVFNVAKENYPSTLSEIAEVLIECLNNRGTIYAIDRTQDKIALEIWIKYTEDGEMSCYYMFPYTQAVINIGGETANA